MKTGGLILALFLLGAALLLQACDNNRRPREEPRSGGLVLTTETPAPETDASSGAAGGTAPTKEPSTPTPTPLPTPVPLAVGERVIGAAQVRLYAAPSSTAAVLEVYEPGAIFTVMESDVESDAYPILIAGKAWYRVRAADGLAGWARAEVFSEK